MNRHCARTHAIPYPHYLSLSPFNNPPLNRGLVRHRRNALRLLLSTDRVRLPRLRRLPLQEHRLALRLGLLPLPRVLLDAVEELLARARMAHVLDADVDALLDVPVADLLVENDSHR